MTAQEEVEFPVFRRSAVFGSTPVYDLCEKLAPHTEASEGALAIEYITGMGALIGPHVYVLQGPTPHPPRLNCLIIGASGLGRKGTAHSLVKHILGLAAPEFFPHRMIDGLASGQGLSRAVLNAIRNVQTNDPDMRFWIAEEEAVNLITANAVGPNAMSAVIRKAFDSGDINRHTAKGSVVISGAHICISAHITEDEYKQRMPRLQTLNGFLNRFQVYGVQFSGTKRQKDTIIPSTYIDSLVNTTSEALAFSAQYDKDHPLVLEWGIGVDDAFDTYRYEHHQRLAQIGATSFGAAVARADTHIMRMAVVFAILDHSRRIKTKHLDTAVSVWKHSEETLRYLYKHPDPNEDEDLLGSSLMMAGPTGLNTRQRRKLFGDRTDRLHRAEAALMAKGLIVMEEVQGPNGRPAKMAWHVEHKPTNPQTEHTFDEPGEGVF